MQISRTTETQDLQEAIKHVAVCCSSSAARLGDRGVFYSYRWGSGGTLGALYSGPRVQIAHSCSDVSQMPVSLKVNSSLLRVNVGIGRQGHGNTEHGLKYTVCFRLS